METRPKKEEADDDLFIGHNLGLNLDIDGLRSVLWRFWRRLGRGLIGLCPGLEPEAAAVAARMPRLSQEISAQEESVVAHQALPRGRGESWSVPLHHMQVRPQTQFIHVCFCVESIIDLPGGKSLTPKVFQNDKIDPGTAHFLENVLK